MTHIPNAAYTSRGTYIVKKAEICEGVFRLNDIRSAQGDFVNELNEIHRYKGTEINIPYIADNTTPNTLSIEEEFKNRVFAEIDALLPKTGDLDDPIILEVIPNIEIKVRYVKAPYIERPISEIESGECENA